MVLRRPSSFAAQITARVDRFQPCTMTSWYARGRAPVPRLQRCLCLPQSGPHTTRNGSRGKRCHRGLPRNLDMITTEAIKDFTQAVLLAARGNKAIRRKIAQATPISVATYLPLASVKHVRCNFRTKAEDDVPAKSCCLLLVVSMREFRAHDTATASTCDYILAPGQSQRVPFNLTLRTDPHCELIVALLLLASRCKHLVITPRRRTIPDRVIRTAGTKASCGAFV